TKKKQSIVRKSKKSSSKSTRKGTSKKKASHKSVKTQKTHNLYYIFDANFYINLHKIKAYNYLDRLNEIKQELGLKYYISDLVFKELHFIKGSRAVKFKKFIKVVDISEEEILEVKWLLESKGIKETLFAQDPDLSLVALAKKLMEGGNKVIIVSDDYKLSQNVKILNLGIEFISLSAFFLFIMKNSSNKGEVDYFSEIRSKILKITLSYILERKEIYNAQNKLIWLIEKAVTVTEDGEFDLTEIHEEVPKQKSKSKRDSLFKTKTISELNPFDEKEQKLYAVAQRYIQTSDLDEEWMDKMILLLPLLDEIKENKRIISAAQDFLKEDEYKKAVDALYNARNKLMELLQLGRSLLPRQDYMVFQNLIFTELSGCEFLRAFLYISGARVNDAIDALNATAMYSSIVLKVNSILVINYLKALIFMYNKMYSKSITQFAFTEKLANNYNKPLLALKCKIGKAIALFLTGMQGEAVDIIEDLNKEITNSGEDSLENSLIVFQELGDYFYAIASPKIAMALYGEALECAVDNPKLKWRINFILDKYKRAYMSSIIEPAQEGDNIEIILDKAHELKNVEEYNKQIAKLGEFNKLFYEPFPIFTKKDTPIDYYKLPDSLKNVFDVVDIIEGKENMVLIGYNKNVGLIGFRTRLETKLSGLPQDYTIRITNKAKVKILKPSERVRNRYLIRAIIVSTKKEDFNIDRNIPVFFTQLISSKRGD
ncbi:MAG: hypothetical protein ACTSVC_03515, partial [Promethearchaeota archaeon]